MGLAEILAAKKAAASKEAPITKEEIVPPTEEKSLPSPIAAMEETAAQVPPKPLSFAEKMALKKKEEEKKEAPSEPVSPAPSLAAPPVPIPAKVDTGTIVAQADAVDADAAQAYANIKEKLDTLSEMSGTDLESAMKDLKRALMQNPAAVSLMEDTDIGKLVIALRKITGEALIDAAKDKKAGSTGRKKSKDVDLSNPDAVASIFEEL